MRVAHAAEAHVDHARAAVDGPVDGAGLGVRRDRPVGAHDLGDQELDRETDAGDARFRCSSRLRSRPRRRCRGRSYRSPTSSRRSSARRRSGPGGPGGPSRCRSRARRRARSRACGSCAQASKAWIRPRYHCRLISGSFGREREPPRRPHALDPGRAVEREQLARVSRAHGEGERTDLRHRLAGHGLDLAGDGALVGALLDPDREPAGRGLRGHGQGEHERREDEPLHAGPTVSVGLTPGTKPRPGASRARYWPGVSFTCASKSPF